MITRYFCPFPECGWHHWRRTSSTLAEPGSIGDYFSTDQVIGAHLATHTPLEWATHFEAERAAREQAERDLDSIIGAWRNMRDYDEAVRRFHETTGTAQADIGDIKARILAMAGDIQEASAGND